MSDKGHGGGGLAFAAGALSRGEGGRLASGAGLTDQQTAFVSFLAANGGSPENAAAAAGYAYPAQEAARLLKNPAVSIALQSALVKRFGPMAAEALPWLGAMADGTEPATGPRVAAIRLILEGAGIVGKGRIAIADDGNKPIGAMSLAEIRQQIADMAGDSARVVKVQSPESEAP